MFAEPAQTFRVRIRTRYNFAQLAELWLAKEGPRFSDSHRRECQRVLRREIWPALGARLAHQIGSRDIAIFLDSLQDRPGVARNAFAVLSGVYRWARKRGLLESNPVQGLNPPKSKGRARVLTEAEIREGWHAAPYAGDYGRILRLCLLTGCRREEIGGLQWTEIEQRPDGPVVALPGSRTKNRRAHVIPLSPLALAQLPPKRDDYPNLFGGRPGRPFQGWHEGGDRLALKLGYKPSRKTWTLHDLRRTMVTIMSEKGLAEPHIIEAVVNHLGGHRAGVAGVYNRAAYAGQKRAALEA